jgi:hypothetical protein
VLGLDQHPPTTQHRSRRPSATVFVGRILHIEVLRDDRPATAKRTAAFVVRSVRTLRFELIAIAGRLVNRSGVDRLCLARNRQVETTYARVEEVLPHAA